MNRFWMVQSWPSEDEYESLVRYRPLLNAADVFYARQPSGTLWCDFPVARLKMPLDGFACDCFSLEGLTFVSKRLRSLMALPPAAAQYFDVDLSQSSATVQACDYKVMNVSNLEDAIDLWAQPAITAPDGAVLGFGKAFRQDFEPAYDVFHDRTERGHVFCTDALAMRVLAAGCAAVRFVDPARYRAGPNAFRTLRGIERRNPETLEPELIEAID